MKYALCNYKTSEEIQNLLISKGIRPILLPPYSLLSDPVSSHPDMLLFVHNNCIYTFREYYKENKKLFNSLPFKVFLVNEEPSKLYPQDILLNAFVCNGSLYGNTDHLSSSILDLYEKKVKVNQGYAACSTLVLGKKACISSDPSICNALKANGIDVLQINSGEILLRGYDYGFIGGASCMISEKELLFFGDIEKHSSYTAIVEFVKKSGVSINYIKNVPLTDIGGIKII
ncbi:MAG: hypothetical protein E7623_03105 [Ruminococcaceae bacterium]|nr:hypothetical protein [Oscillospiraceae bacterium]